jgi:hypothetical protein
MVEARVPQRDITGVYAHIAWMYDAWAVMTDAHPRDFADATFDLLLNNHIFVTAQASCHAKP